MQVHVRSILILAVLVLVPACLRADAAGEKALLDVVGALSALSDFEVGFEARSAGTQQGTGIEAGRLMMHRAGELVDLSVSGRLQGKQGQLKLAVSKLGEKLYLSMEPPAGGQAQPMAFFVDLSKMPAGKKAPLPSPREVEVRTRGWLAKKEADVTRSGNRIVIRNLAEQAASGPHRPDRVEIVFDGRSKLPLMVTAYKADAPQGTLNFSGWKTGGTVRISPALALASYRPFDMRMLGGILAPLAGAMGPGGVPGAGGNPFAAFGAPPAGPAGTPGTNPFAGGGANPFQALMKQAQERQKQGGTPANPLGGLFGKPGAAGGTNPFEALMKQAQERQKQGGTPVNPLGGLFGKPGAAGGTNPFEALMKQAQERQKQGGAPANPLGGLFGKPGAAGGTNPFEALMKQAQERQKQGGAPANPLEGLFGAPGGSGDAMQDPKFQEGMKKFQEGLLQMQKRLMQMKNESGSGASPARP